MNIRFRYAALSGLAMAISGPASAIVIDNFSAGATDLQIVGTTGTQESQQNVSVVGGQRDVMLAVTSNPFQRVARYEIVPTQGMSFYSSGPGLTGRVSLDYDGIETENLTDGTQTAGPGLNLNLTGDNAFRFNFTFADEGLQVRVDAFTTGGGSSTRTASVSSGLNSATNLDLAFSSFTSTSGSGVNFADVDRIVVTFTGNGAASDFALGGISTVPEPASMAALAVGALGLIARRRARRKA